MDEQLCFDFDLRVSSYGTQRCKLEYNKTSNEGDYELKMGSCVFSTKRIHTLGNCALKSLAKVINETPKNNIFNDFLLH